MNGLSFCGPFMSPATLMISLSIDLFSVSRLFLTQFRLQRTRELISLPLQFVQRLVLLLIYCLILRRTSPMNKSLRHFHYYQSVEVPDHRLHSLGSRLVLQFMLKSLHLKRYLAGQVQRPKQGNELGDIQQV